MTHNHPMSVKDSVTQISNSWRKPEPMDFHDVERQFTQLSIPYNLFNRINVVKGSFYEMVRDTKRVIFKFKQSDTFIEHSLLESLKAFDIHMHEQSVVCRDSFTLSVTTANTNFRLLHLALVTRETNPDHWWNPFASSHLFTFKCHVYMI